MKKLGLFFMILMPFLSFGQVNESFLDGNFINTPNWTGTTANFMVNSAYQLQSQAATTSTSWLFTPSEVINNASWECWVKINYTTSSSNYSAIYIISDQADLTSGCNGYYVQIGGTNDEISLYVQQGTKKTKIIDGVDKRTDGNPVEFRIKVTRDDAGNFVLYSKKPSEADYVVEGSATNQLISSSKYFGVLYANTTTTGSDYYFDDIVVTGSKQEDNVAPIWKRLSISGTNRVSLTFSEPMDFTHSAYEVSDFTGSITSQVVSADKTTVDLSFNTDFETGRLYSFCLTGIADLAGNRLADSCKTTGIIEQKQPGDLVINEIMFENPVNSLEYVEIYNKSSKYLDISGCIVGSLRSDKSYSTVTKIPVETYLLPDSYIAITEDADSVFRYHNCSSEARIVSSEWTSLNNDAATIALLNTAKDTTYDAVTYSTKWHHPLVKNPKGVALERINPELPSNEASSWHSASSETLYGTPGYRNSQYREIQSGDQQKLVWLEPEAFTPDNDGIDDVCMIHYQTESAGYVCNALILTPNGEKVFQIAQNQLLGSAGFFTWDGKTQKGKNVNAGVYVLYFELFNPTNGNRKKEKLPIVVSFR
ncbi:MAG: hypothetical protein RIS29_959 [Bacteroidota bacterium]|jgi:hypothetical protein